MASKTAIPILSRYAARGAAIFRATHIALGRSVQVCKISASDDEHLASIREQACTVAAMGHPNITAIIDADWDGDEPYYVMDNVLDATLRERLDEGPFTADAGLQLAIDLFSALLFVHDHGTTHGSVSPARIYFDAFSAARLGDFGASAASADPAARSRPTPTPWLTCPSRSCVTLGVRRLHRPALRSSHRRAR